MHVNVRFNCSKFENICNKGEYEVQEVHKSKTALWDIWKESFENVDKKIK